MRVVEGKWGESSFWAWVHLLASPPPPPPPLVLASNFFALSSSAPCGSPSTWEKPHTSPDKVTNPSHFTAPSGCTPNVWDGESVIGDRWEDVAPVQGVSCCSRQLWRLHDELWRIRESTPQLRVTSPSDDTPYNNDVILRWQAFSNI